MTPHEAHRDFLRAFNEDLARLGCGARGAAVAGSTSEMGIVDLDGLPIGRVPTRIEPEAFCAFMLIVEESFAEGARSHATPRGHSAVRH